MKIITTIMLALLFIVSVENTQFMDGGPSVSVNGYKFLFLNKGHDIEVTCYTNEKYDDNETSDTNTLKAIISISPGTESQWSSGSQFDTEVFYLLSIDSVKAYRYTITEIDYSFYVYNRDCGCDEAREVVGRYNASCYIFPVSGQFKLKQVKYDYTTSAGDSYQGEMELTDAQKQTNSLNCKYNSDLIDMHLELAPSTDDYPWLEDFMNENDFDISNLSIDLTNQKTSITETDDGPKLTVTDPDVTDNNEVSGEIHFTWRLIETAEGVNLELRAGEYPFIMVFEPS